MVKIALEHALKAQRVSGIIALLFFNLGDRRGWGFMINATLRPFYPWERGPVLLVQKAGWAPSVGLGACEKFRSHRDSIPGAPNAQRAAILTKLSRRNASQGSWFETVWVQIIFFPF